MVVFLVLHNIQDVQVFGNRKHVRGVEGVTLCIAEETLGAIAV